MTERCLRNAHSPSRGQYARSPKAHPCIRRSREVDWTDFTGMVSQSAVSGQPRMLTIRAEMISKMPRIDTAECVRRLNISRALLKSSVQRSHGLVCLVSVRGDQLLEYPMFRPRAFRGSAVA